MPQGTVKHLKMDQSFFATPKSVATFSVINIDLRSIAQQMVFSPYWHSVTMRNANLNQVPSHLSNVSHLQIL